MRAKMVAEISIRLLLFNINSRGDEHAAREHFDETSTLELSFSRLIFAMRYQKLSPRLIHARITQESYKPTVQVFYLFQDSPVLPLLCNNNNITGGPLQQLQ